MVGKKMDMDKEVVMVEGEGGDGDFWEWNCGTRIVGVELYVGGVLYECIV
jgi:hypothetical protein